MGPFQQRQRGRDSPSRLSRILPGNHDAVERKTGLAGGHQQYRPAGAHHRIADVQRLMGQEGRDVRVAADDQQIGRPRLACEKFGCIGHVRPPLQRMAERCHRFAKPAFAAIDILLQPLIIRFQHACRDHAVGMDGGVGKAGGDTDHLRFEDAGEFAGDAQCRFIRMFEVEMNHQGSVGHVALLGE